MDLHEEIACKTFIWFISFWMTRIDVISLIFFGTTNQFQSLKDFMNNLHHTTKFVFEHCTQQISFHDTKIRIRAERKLFTTLYRKPADFAALSHFHSDHSLKCKDRIIFLQALRYNFLIADNTQLQKELDFLIISLLAYSTLRKSFLTILSKPSTLP